ncbi:MAG: serine hydrolase domain-containing protein, partial [Candidatus Baltobacteraceae bacterium]
MRSADDVLREATGKTFTAAVARVEHRGVPVFERAYGVTRQDSGARAVYADTAFDLASITKLFVATLALRAVQDGTLALDVPVLHEGITLRMLLSHTAGINSGADYRQLLGHNVVAFANARELVARPGERVIYSDLGFIALGDLLERSYGCSLDALMRGLRRSPFFRPRAAQKMQIPATEEDAWRGRVQGAVHDEKAHLLGGIAGHAGLFGTASDVAWLTEQYLGPLNGRTHDTLHTELVREAVSEQADDPVLRRGLGWALKTSDENSCGRFFSRDSFGHTGFVGTCVWADPVRDCCAVLLTNSVYFGRSDTRDLRAAFYDAAVA